MGKVFFFGWEIPLMLAFQSVGSTFLTAVATLFTVLGEEYPLVLVLGFLYWCCDKELARRVGLAFSGAIVFSTVLKGLALRRRPYMDSSEVRCIRAAYPKEDPMSSTAQGFSLPSLHSSLSAAIYGTLAREKKTPFFVTLSILLPLLIGLSRIYLGVHYPTDVLTGWLLGAVTVFLFPAFTKGRDSYKLGFVTVLLIGTIGFFTSRDFEFFSGWGIVCGILLGSLYEEKYVHFEYTRKWQSRLLRPLLGIALFVFVSGTLKKLGSGIPGELPALFYRTLRYTVSTFVIIGPYTQLFRKLGI